MGFQRALLAQGARSALVTLWSVADEPNTLLMDRFYAHWLVGPDRPSKSRALQLAQADLREDKDHPEYAPPRFWAAFQLIGAP